MASALANAVQCQAFTAKYGQSVLCGCTQNKHDHKTTRILWLDGCARSVKVALAMLVLRSLDDMLDSARDHKKKKDDNSIGGNLWLVSRPLARLFGFNHSTLETMFAPMINDWQWFIHEHAPGWLGHSNYPSHLDWAHSVYAHPVHANDKLSCL